MKTRLNEVEGSAVLRESEKSPKPHRRVYAPSIARVDMVRNSEFDFSELHGS